MTRFLLATIAGQALVASLAVAQGWLLLAPASEGSGVSVRIDGEPMVILSAFDTATACERSRASRQRAGQQLLAECIRETGSRCTGKTPIKECCPKLYAGGLAARLIAAMPGANSKCFPAEVASQRGPSSD